jgi:hypothetical protein
MALSITRSSQCALLVTCITIAFGCARSIYPDQHEVFIRSAEGKGYELLSISGPELELHEQRSFDRASIALNVVKQRFSTDTNVVQFIDSQIERMRHYHEDSLMEQKRFTKTLDQQDRVFRFVYEGESGYETGILVIRDGKVVRKIIE